MQAMCRFSRTAWVPSTSCKLALGDQVISRTVKLHLARLPRACLQVHNPTRNSGRVLDVEGSRVAARQVAPVQHHIA